jgi:hypothetical protein
VYLLVYVDDLLIATQTKERMARVKRELMDLFDIRDLGPASHFLGMTVSRDRSSRTLSVSQSTMARDIVSRFGMSDSRPRSIPFDVGLKLTPATDELELLDTSSLPFAEVVGSLLYIAVCTRPDLSYAVNTLARYMSKPTKLAWDAALSVLRYLHKTSDAALVFSASASGLLAFSDSDFAADMHTRRSITGYAFILNGGAISWSSKLQPTVAVSTAESEYMAASSTVKESIWIRCLLFTFDIHMLPVVIQTDNQAALALVKNPILSTQSKHIDVQIHFARERFLRGEVSFVYCPTANMAADFLTKSVPLGKHRYCAKALGLTSV